MNNTETVAVVGMGNALTDLLIRIDDDSLLAKLKFAKGSMNLVEKQVIHDIMHLTAGAPTERASGGSAANTISGLARLGISTAFIGTVGDDDDGAFYSRDLATNRIRTHIATGREESGRAVVLVSPDGERTFAVFLGAAVELSPEHLVGSMVDGCSWFHFEGYLLSNRGLVDRSIDLVTSRKGRISIDLASFNIVEEYRDYLKELMNGRLDLIFANEDEARIFTGHDDPARAAESLAHGSPLAVVKCGARGSYIASGDRVEHIDAVVARAVDTTGAGDLYAAGFLYGLVKGYPLALSGKIGSILGGHVVEMVGARLDQSRWEQAMESIRRLTE